MKTKKRKAVNVPVGTIMTIGNQKYSLDEVKISDEDALCFTFLRCEHSDDLVLFEDELQEFLERGFHFEYPDSDDYQSMEDILEEIAEWYSENNIRDIEPSEISRENLYRLLRKAANMINPET